VIFIDSNIPMYLVGVAHPNKVGAQRLLERAIADREHLVSDVEVLQEILHRYVAIERRDAIQPAFETLLGVVDEVFDVVLADAQRAKDILLAHPRLSARDALHVAVMEPHGVERILTFDTGFDQVPGIARVR
jgi:hypothetical protein